MTRQAIAMLAASIWACACKDADRDTPRTTTAAASSGSSTRSSNQHIEISSQLSPSARKAATHARDALLVACAGSQIDWADFQEVTLTTSNAIGYLKDKYDWDLTITVGLTYREGLDQHRGGHRLTFDMGAGNRPGIVTRKSHGIRLCGFGGRAEGVSSGKPCDSDAGEDCILDVPGLKVLDAARPPSVVPSDRTAIPAWCFAHGVSPPASWSCASSEKACKKARTAEKREENGDYRVRSECAKTESLHCFEVDSGKTACAPDASTCSTSRKEWTNLNTATPCEVATPAMLTASSQPDD